MTRHIHMMTAETVMEHGKEQRRRLCGVEPAWLNTGSDDAARVDCPKCAKMMGEAALATRAADAPKLEMIKDEATYYRFGYRALVGGEHVAWIGYEGAYKSGRWYVSVISIDDADAMVIGHQLDIDPDRRYPVKMAFAAKELALAAVPGLLEARRIWSEATIRTQRAGALERYNARREQERREDAEEADALALTIAGLEEIRAADLGLSNLQVAALEDAILRLKRPSH